MKTVEKTNLSKWIKAINLNFRIQYKFRNEKRYKIIGAGTVVKLVGNKTALEAFCKVIDSKQDIPTFDVKNVVRFKFYSK